MMRLLWLLLLGAVSATPVPKRAEMYISKGQEIPIESPDYPRIPEAGTKITWLIDAEPHINVLLVCEDLRISPSTNCEKGYFLVHDGVRQEKYCGSENGLTVKSVANRMILEFDVTWSSGLAKCIIKGVAEDEGTKEPGSSGTGTGDGKITLTPGGAAYDDIYISYIQRDTHKKWEFITTPGTRISLHCTEILMSERCEEGRVEIIDGNTRENLCGFRYAYKKISTGNTLTVELTTTVWRSGRLNCLVQAVTGPISFQYRNIISREVDSSEYGKRPGVRQTDCKCGWSAKTPGRIVNGQEVAEGQYPWVVTLNHLGSHLCGGSIITAYHILTAAHCVDGREARNFQIFTGTTNNKHTRHGEVIPVKEIISHDYRRKDYHENDIAIMLLERQIQFTDRIGPVCLTPTKVNLDHAFITVMGWGALGEEGGWRNPEQMMRAHMRVVDYNTCSYLWYRKFETASPNRVCTWASNRDSCFGDSGGPLVWLDPETNRYTQIGLVSFGRGCNTDFPKVNSNVAHYYSWIQEIIKRTYPGVMTCKKI
uniref:Venom S1 protease with CUB domain 2 n=1 Tax=Oncocephalus sp. TaxID=2944721 RepID=A0AB38ZEG8_9HEMI